MGRHLLLGFALGSTLVCQAREPLDSTLPDRILVGMEPMSAVQFTLWKTDPVMYAGKFTGPVSNDTVATLEVRVTGGTTDSPRFMASGTYREEQAGAPPIVVEFHDATFHKRIPTVLDAGAFRVDFIRFRDTAGVLIAGAFIPRHVDPPPTAPAPEEEITDDNPTMNNPTPSEPDTKP